jgi:hypothetical protein
MLTEKELLTAIGNIPMQTALLAPIMMNGQN